MAIEEVYLHPEDYDLEVASRQVEDLPFWLEVVRRETPRRVLEIGCGTGRLTIPLGREGWRRGFHVTGLEAEQPMLERARRCWEDEPERARKALSLVHGDVRSLDLPGTFDLVLMPYGVAHHLLTLDDQEQAFRAVRRHMRPGGLFCVDVGAPDMQFLARATAACTDRVMDMDVGDRRGRQLRRSVASAYQPAEQLMMHHYRYESDQPGGAHLQYPSDFSMHVYFPRELLLLCRLAGFTVESLSGSYDGEPFNDSSTLLIVAARA